MLEALPGSVMVATVLPIVVRDGITAMLAIGVAVVVMLLVRRNDPGGDHRHGGRGVAPARSGFNP